MAEEMVQILNFPRTFWEAEQAGYLDHTALHSEVLFRFRGRISQARVREIAHHLCEMHVILNSRVKIRNKEPFLEIVEGIDGVEISEIYLNPGSGNADIEAAARAEFRKKFDLANSAPMRMVMIALSPDECVFGAIVHHMIYDSATLEILAEDIKSLLVGQKYGIEREEYLTFSEYTKITRSLRDASNLTYWKDRIAGDLTP